MAYMYATLAIKRIRKYGFQPRVTIYKEGGTRGPSHSPGGQYQTQKTRMDYTVSL